MASSIHYIVFNSHTMGTSWYVEMNSFTFELEIDWIRFRIRQWSGLSDRNGFWVTAQLWVFLFIFSNTTFGIRILIFISLCYNRKYINEEESEAGLVAMSKRNDLILWKHWCRWLDTREDGATIQLQVKLIPLNWVETAWSYDSFQKSERANEEQCASSSITDLTDRSLESVKIRQYWLKIDRINVQFRPILL